MGSGGGGGRGYLDTSLFSPSQAAMVSCLLDVVAAKMPWTDSCTYRAKQVEPHVHVCTYTWRGSWSHGQGTEVNSGIVTTDSVSSISVFSRPPSNPPSTPIAKRVGFSVTPSSEDGGGSGYEYPG